MDEIILTGYCRKIDGSRILCCEPEDGKLSTDCLYPDCEYAQTCTLIKSIEEKINGGF